MALSRLSFSWLKETPRSTKQCTGNLPLFGAEKKWNCARALPAFFLRLVELAAGTASGMWSGIQSGLRFDGVRALRSAAGCAARTESAQAWTALASSTGGGVGGGALSATRLAAERELRHGTWRRGIPQGSLGAAAGKTRHPRGACRCGLL